MWSDLKTIVDIMRTAGAGLHAIRSRAKRRRALVGLLRTYYVLYDVVHNGRELLVLAGDDPLRKLESASPAEAEQLARRFQEGIANQGVRLYGLAGLVREQDVLTLVAPDLQERIDEVVGDKMDRTRTLAGVVAGLVISTMFGTARDDRPELAGLVQSMYEDLEGNQLDVEAASREIDDLALALDGLRAVCGRFASDEELLVLAKEARTDAAHEKTKA